MTTPRYIAKRIGSEYVLVRVDPPEVAKRVGWTAAGVLLLGWGAQRRGVSAALATIAGAALTYHGWTGHNPINLVCGSCAKLEEDPKQAPSYPHRGPRSGQLPEDKIDEAAMESFPASDPPASHRSSSIDDIATTVKSDESTNEAVKDSAASATTQDQPRNVNM